MKLRFRILLPYAILLALSVFAGFFFYGRVMGAYSQSKAAQNIHILERSLDDLERNLETLKLNQFYLSHSTGLKQIKKLDYPFSGSNVILLDEFYDDLQLIDEKDDQGEILDFGVFFLTNRLVINRDGIYKFSEYYENFFLFDNMPYGKWNVFLKNELFAYDITAKAHLEIDGTEYEGNLLLYTDGLNRKSRDAVICYYLNETFFTSSFADLNVEDGGHIYCLNEAGELIFGEMRGDSLRDFPHRSGYIREKNRIISYVINEDLGWTVVYDQSYRILFREVLMIRNFSIAFSIFYLIFTVAVSLYFFRRNYRMFEDLFTLMKGKPKVEKKRPDLYDQIKKGLEELQNEHRTLITHDQEQAVLLRNHVFTSLLEGTQNHWEEDFLDRYILGGEKGGLYAVSIISGNREEPSFGGAPSLIIREDLIRAHVPSLLFHTVMGGKGIILHRSGRDNPDAAQGVFIAELTDLARAAEGDTGQDFSAALGDPVRSANRISRSYAQASQMASHLRIRGLNGVYPYRAGDLNRDVYIPAGTVQILSAAIVSHDEGRIGECFRAWEEQFTDESLLLVNRQFFLTNLYTEIVRLLSELKEGDDSLPWDPSFFARIHQPGEALKFLRDLKENCLTVSREREDRKQSHNRGLLEKIKDHIHREFGDPNLSALAIAEEFDISELYFYRFFKEQQGMTFADYLENLRLEEAKKLLAESYKVKDVARMAGYNSSTAFGRAFKRKWGVTAGDYRESLE